MLLCFSIIPLDWEWNGVLLVFLIPGSCKSSLHIRNTILKLKGYLMITCSNNASISVVASWLGGGTTSNHPLGPPVLNCLSLPRDLIYVSYLEAYKSLLPCSRTYKHFLYKGFRPYDSKDCCSFIRTHLFGVIKSSRLSNE